MIKREGNVIVAVMLMLLIIPAFLAAETAVLPGYMAPAPPVIDGVLDEAIWTSAQKLTGLKTFKPDFGKVPSERTEVLLAHDKDNLYVAFRCHAKDVSQVKSSVTKRDNIFSDDLIGILLDTFSDNQSGYGFVVNPQGIQGDGMMNAEGDLDPSADFVWFSKGRMDAEGYTVECRIPATSIRFPSREKLRMKVMIIRQIVRTSEMAVFPEVPGDSGAFLSHCVPVDFSGLKFKRVVELLPAFTNSSQRALDEGAMAAADTHRDVSLTAKVGLTPGMTLDAAYNPDFSQVEADAGQVDVNLRYNLFYDEKRPFFLEGMEIFRFAGNTEDAPLYSIVHTRNIADPVFGLKLSGKISRRNTVAAIVARDQLPGDDGGPTRADFGILRFLPGGVLDFPQCGGGVQPGCGIGRVAPFEFQQRHGVSPAGVLHPPRSGSGHGIRARPGRELQFEQSKNFRCCRCSGYIQGFSRGFGVYHPRRIDTPGRFRHVQNLSQIQFYSEN